MFARLYKTLLSIALSFLILDIFSLFFLRTGSAEFVACILGIILLIVFIIGITLDYYWEMRRGG